MSLNNLHGYITHNEQFRKLTDLDNLDIHLDPNETNSGTLIKIRVRHVSLISSRFGRHAILLRCVRSMVLHAGD